MVSWMTKPIEINSTSWNQYAHQLAAIAHLGLEQQIKNAGVALQISTIDNMLFPVTINLSKLSTTCWIASLLNTYGLYARHEAKLVQLSQCKKFTFIALTYVAEWLLKISNLTGGLYAYNWLVSTNLYPKNFSEQHFFRIKNQLLAQYPQQAIAFRSLTPAFHEETLQVLKSKGFLLLPTRQVWVLHDVDTEHWKKKKDIKNDIKFEQSALAYGNTAWLTQQQFSEEDFVQAITLYQQLYRSKYCIHNPDYTVAFLKAATESGFMRLFGLKDKSTNTLIGMFAVIQQDDVCACPMIGYDPESPMELGLYRRLSLKLFEETAKLGKHLHCSSGVDAFKFSRGAEAYPEYVAVWINHFTWYQRCSLKILSFMVNILFKEYIFNQKFKNQKSK